MQFSGKLNEAEVKEALRFVRPKGYAWRMALTNIRLVIYAILVVVFLWASVAQHRHIPPAIIATRLALLVAVGAYSYFRYRKGSREAVATLDRSLPDTLQLASDGVRLHGPNGAEGFQPWMNYTGFREGQHVVLLQRKDKGLYNVLPVSEASPAERESLRGLLSSYLPAPPLSR